MKRILRLIAVMAVTALVIFGSRWYSYVTNTESPYQQVGIDINSHLPGPLNQWGCDRLHATFGNVPPPLGCESSTNGKQWR